MPRTRNRVVLNDVAKAVTGDRGEGDGDNGSGEDKASDFFRFCVDPMYAIGSGFG